MSKKADMQALMEAFLRHTREEYEALDPPSTDAQAPQTLMLPMGDGVKLRTVIRKPAGEGPFPAILLRSCYPQSEAMLAVDAEAYARRGFAFVYQFCRGTGGSEGVWEPNVNDRADGKTTADWLDGLAWVDCIGWLGSSYTAFTGWVVADILPDKVKTMYLTHYGTDRFVSAYQRGLFRQDVLTAWAMENAGKPVTADYEASARYRPQISVDTDVWHTGELPWYRDWITNTSRTDAYWNTGFWKMLDDIPAKVKIPVYLGESWYDHHLGSALQTWRKLSPASRRHSTLRIGAWNHMFQPCLGDHTIEHIENSNTRTAYEWFDQILKKKQLPQSRVLLYNTGADLWEQEPAYPFPEAQTLTLYFSGERDDTRTLAKRVAPQGSASYLYNPDDPVRSSGAESLLRNMQDNGSLPQPPPDYRADVLSFLSQPLDRDTTILGRITAQLFVASDAQDTAFTAKVMEVLPDGRTRSIRGSITTLAYRGDPDAPRASYTPGQIVRAGIDMWDVMYTLRRGSRIRVDISSSDFPQYAVHPNTAGIWSLQAKARSARQTLYFGTEYPSAIVIPLK